MSPEQWGELSRDGKFEIDGRADLYSLGLVAYQMISGRRPYSAVTLNALRQEHISVSPPPLNETVSGVSKAFSDVINRAISKDRADRQSTAGELAAQLRSALLETPETGSVEKVSTDPDLLGAYTLRIDGAAETRSDVDAPTIITMDPVPTSGPRGAAAVSPEAVGDFSTPDPLGSSETQLRPRAEANLAVPQESLPAPQQSLSAPQESKRKPFMLIGAGVLVLCLAVLGVGGFLAMNWLKTKPSQPESPEKGATLPKGANVPPGNETTATAKEVANYWLEVLPNELAAQPTLVAGTNPLASGQAFKFHFEFDESGYLYIVGPGIGNEPTAFLTVYPAEISGLENNKVSKGADFSFPKGIEHWLELDKKPATETYTIIFSRSPLTEPALFTEPVTGKPLSDSQQKELSTFVEKHRTSEPVTELNDKNASKPFVTVKVPGSQLQDSSAPLVFSMKIQHK
jgi:hypothetical protein